MSDTGGSASDRSTAEIAYNAIAPFYDEFTATHDYELWLGNLLPVLVENGLSGHRLLDVGCGTGKSFLPMLDRGWDVVGCDISPAMLAVAETKIGERPARLMVADMRELPVLGVFDLVWALDDAVNYLLGEDELVQALTAMAANLGPSGLLTFDVNTLATYREFFAQTSEVESQGRRLIFRGETASDAVAGSICEARFEVEGADVPPRVHRQRHFADVEVKRALAAAGLKCLAVFGFEEDAVLHRPLDEAVHTKAIYVASASVS